MFTISPPRLLHNTLSDPEYLTLISSNRKLETSHCEMLNISPDELISSTLVNPSDSTLAYLATLSEEYALFNDWSV